MKILVPILLLISQLAGAESPKLPAPQSAHTYGFSDVIGWKGGEGPTAPPGFKVEKFADGLRNPRWIYVLPNGDILVAEAKTESGTLEKIGSKIVGADKSEGDGRSANRITILRDWKSGQPKFRQTFLEGLDRPFGMLYLNGFFYAGATDGVFKYAYKLGDLKISGAGKKILELPAGGYNNHWTRNLISNSEGTKIYVTVGSGSNRAEHGMENEIRRANILEINPDRTGEKIFASGLRNPVGMGWAPNTKTLWTVVNERDNLGDDLVPDYFTSVKSGGFYGWPYSYFGTHPDPDFKDHQPDIVKRALVPDLALGSHTASLGLAFYEGKMFPAKYQGGAFIGQHGSWNSTKLVGYRVAFVPFKNGVPGGEDEDFLTGFISNLKEKKVHGRPVGVTVLPDGSLLVADDVSNTLWRVTYSSGGKAP